ncbi:D-aspartate oxidase [Gadus macrocephalus]|uniref:D-aspartate oxidase n=1 Tax=Gadus macrocephalus TaxID=80720 RepID=UPI0028CB8821|nr:D-aspartate oxidase [Gadus macrocephalus]
MKRVKVVVVGAGVIGFSTAVCIAESLPLCAVTLVADQFSPDTTSDGAAGIMFVSKYPDIDLERQRRWFKDSFDHLLAIAQSDQAPEAGVMLSSGCQIFREVPAETVPFWADLVHGFRFLTQSELKRFPEHCFGQAFTTIKCECSAYLPWLEKRFRRAGGKVQQSHVNHLQELAGTYDLIVNCSGLGARSLVGDQQVHPVRGQVLKVQAPWINHFIRDGDGLTYFYPGVHSLTVGGTRQEGDRRLEADPADSEDILRRCCLLEPSLAKGKVLGEWVGLRPGRRNPRVEREVLGTQGSARRVHVVHNYGHGGGGVTLAWGTALDALGLVKQILNGTGPPQARL